MRQIYFLIILSLGSLLSTSCNSSIQNSKTEVHQVSGNCNMCKKTIEKAVNQDGIAKGEWDKNKKLLTITYDCKKTNADDILQRVADVGYDNDRYTALDKDYLSRPECCQYERKPLQ